MRVLAIAAMSWTAGCASPPNEPVSPTPSRAPAVATAAPATGSPRDGVVFHAYGVDLEASGDVGSNRIVILPDATGVLTVTLRGMDGSIRVCAVTAAGASSTCSTPADKTPVTVSALGVEIVKPAGKDHIDEIAVAYSPETRRVRVRAPHIIPKPGQSVCKDNGCNPFYEFTPHRAGTVTAIATWEGRAKGKLLVEVGEVAEREWSASGRPYDVPVRSTSEGGTVRVSTTMEEPAEVAVVLENEGNELLRRPRLEMTWP